MNKFMSLTAIAVVLSACANPEVVDKRQLGDENLTCEQIKTEVFDVETYEANARKEKGVTGKNVAAAVFFWPAMLVTHSNANEAIDAAKERKAYLLSLADKKRCKI